MTKPQDSWPIQEILRSKDDEKLISEMSCLFEHLSTLGMFLLTSIDKAITFEGVQNSLSNTLGRSFDMRDLVLLKTIAPSMIDYSRVPKSQLEDGIVRQLQGEIQDDIEVTLIEFLDSRLPKRRKILTQSKKKSISTLTKNIESRRKAFALLLNAFCDEARSENESVCDRVLRLSCPHLSDGQSHPSETRTSGDAPDQTDHHSSRHHTNNLIEILKASDIYVDQISENGVHLKSARSTTLGIASISSQLRNALRKAFNVDQLYSHQCRALQEIQSGKHIVVSTSTSSGKSLIYQIPVLGAIESEPESTAFFIFPTKALAQDQKRSMMNLLSHCSSPLKDILLDTYDGDTPLDGPKRLEMRSRGQIILTNPDMLHVSILPHHDLWKRVLSNLRFVIIDELHYYSGAVGVHTSFVLRRLLRLCHKYGNSQVKFIACSATIGNPGRVNFVWDCKSNVSVINENGSPSGEKRHIIWNPPYRNALDPTSGRHDYILESAKIMRVCLNQGLKVICFTKSRRMCELLLRETHSIFKAKRQLELVSKVMSYRGGYSANERRDIERQLFNDELQGIIATNALELGVDIGSLDVVIHAGYPYSAASYWQQCGRAGRRDRASYSILVLSGDNPLEQTIALNPDLLFSDTQFQEISLPMENEEILEAHLQCAAFEEHFHLDTDFRFFIPTCHKDPSASSIQDQKDDLEHVCEKYLRYDELKDEYVTHKRFQPNPSQKVSIRGIHDDDMCRIIDIVSKEIVEEIEMDRVYFTLYEGAIFLHQGQSYIVISVDRSCTLAHVRPLECDYITVNRAFTNVDPLVTEGTHRLTDLVSMVSIDTKSGHIRDLSVSYGSVKIETDVYGYIKLDARTKRVLETIDRVERCPVSSQAYGMWIDVPAGGVLHILQNECDIEFSIHAVSHTILSLIPIYFHGTDMSAFRTDCKSEDSTRFRPARIQIFNTRREKGTVRRLSERIYEVLVRVYQVISACKCENGCTHCIYWKACKFMNSALSKKGAVLLLKYILR